MDALLLLMVMVLSRSWGALFKQNLSVKIAAASKDILSRSGRYSGQRA
jgi:hypothetical protein